MQQVGEKFINDAKSERTYKDRSGNLRASIGYFVLKGDVILNYKIEGKPIGVQAAKDLLKAIVQRFRKRDTIRLIGVAPRYELCFLCRVQRAECNYHAVDGCIGRFGQAT